MIFDSIIPDNFFMPLASPNRQIYSDCIFTIYKYTASRLSFGIEREIIVDLLEGYFEDRLASCGEVDDEIEGAGSRERANTVLRNLIEYGWISVEPIRYTDYINFNDYAIDIIKTLDTISNKSSLEYEGYISTIYKWLSDDNPEDQSAMLIHQVFENTDKLRTGLKRLHSNIRRYMEELTNNSDVSDIIDILLHDYKENIVDKAYHRLVTSDNVSKYRPFIIERLESLSIDINFIESAASQFAEQGDMSYEEGIEEVKNKLESIIDAFKSLDILLNEIDLKNSKYQKSAKNRAKFLLNNSADTAGQLNTVLKYISEDISKQAILLSDIYDNDVIEGIFTIECQQFVDEDSLTIQKERKPRIKNEDIHELDPVEDIDEGEADKILKENIKKANRRREIQKRIDKLLNDQEVGKGSELEISKKSDYIDLIYTFLYGTESNSDYEVEDGTTEVVKGIYKFKDFEIRRKR